MSTSTAQDRSRFLDLRALAALEHLRFAPRHRIEGAYSGQHRSRQHGGAGEFVDYREYVAGEDLRHLDWRVLARTGRAYVRLYQDETELSCTLVLDISGSMRFGAPDANRATGSKLEYVQYLATALSHVITQQRDRVGLALLADGLNQYVPPGGIGEQVARVQSLIESIQPRPSSDLATGFRDLFEWVRRRGVLLIMSDFLVDDLEGAFAGIRLFRHRHWEVVLLHVVHPDEERLPDGVAYRFAGLENDGELDCSPTEIRRLYQERFEAHAAIVRTMSLAAGCDYLRVSTAVGYLQTLSGFLVERTA